MKKIHFLLAAGLFLIGTATASAQFMGSTSRVASTVKGYNSIWLGYNPTTVKYSEDGYSESRDFNTFSLGVLHAAPFQELPLLYEFGGIVEYTNRTDKEEDFDAKVSYNLLGVRVPLNLLYALELSDGFTLYPYIGLNAKGYVIGKASVKVDGQTHSVDLFGKNDSDDFSELEEERLKRFTLGYQLGLRAGFSKYFASIGYTADLTTIADHLKVSMLTLGVGMSF